MDGPTVYAAFASSSHDAMPNGDMVSTLSFTIQYVRVWL